MFIQSVDCRVCVLEIRDARRKKLQEIVAHRKKCRKCAGCERLKGAEERLKR